MHRCWLDTQAPPAVGSMVALSPEESAHVARVLRMKPGDRVQVIAAETLYEAEIEMAENRAAAVRVLSVLPPPEPAVRVTLVQGLPKADKLETIVQKATELGAWAVLPVETARSVARVDAKDRQKKRERWNRIALEAAKQSGRAHVPEVLPALGLADAAAWLERQRFDAVFVAWEEADGLRLGEALGRLLAERPEIKTMALVVGPEGGIEPAEIERLAAAGARCVSLGRRILRTETAGLCALAVIMSALGEM